MNLFTACKTGNLNAVRKTLKNGHNVNATTTYGETPLMFASTPGIAQHLINHGADINATAIDGRTPLIFACQKRRPDVAKLLIEYGADVNAKDYTLGNTPLTWACHNGLHELAQFLLQHGAAPNATTASAFQPGMTRPSLPEPSDLNKIQHLLPLDDYAELLKLEAQ